MKKLGNFYGSGCRLRYLFINLEYEETYSVAFPILKPDEPVFISSYSEGIGTNKTLDSVELLLNLGVVSAIYDGFIFEEMADSASSIDCKCIEVAYRPQDI